MKTQRILGILWMVLCGVPGGSSLWLLLRHAIFYTPAIPHFYPRVLISLLFLVGALAGVFLFRGAQWARGFAGVITVMIVMATITMFVAYKSIPEVYYILSVFTTASVVLLFLPRHKPVA